MRLHHVNVVVAPGRTDDVVPFYVLLGLTRVAKPTEGVAQSGAWFDVPSGTPGGGGAQVHVSERSGDRHPDQHFALVVDDLAAVVTRLREAGHPWRSTPAIGGAQRGMTADPQGNAVELVEAVGPFA
jgi:catechol 2,3-dioxygenase-like lactoylglutathione lyase family enzyme